MRLFAKMEKYRCFVKIEINRLYRCAIKDDGSIDELFGELNWNEVIQPVDLDFLNAANKALGIELRASDLGREAEKRRRNDTI